MNSFPAEAYSSLGDCNKEQLFSLLSSPDLSPAICLLRALWDYTRLLQNEVWLTTKTQPVPEFGKQLFFYKIFSHKFIFIFIFFVNLYVFFLQKSKFLPVFVLPNSPTGRGQYVFFCLVTVDKKKQDQAGKSSLPPLYLPQ